MNGIQQNLTANKIWTSSTKLVFTGPIGETWCRSDLQITKIVSTSHLKSLNVIQRKLTGCKITTIFSDCQLKHQIKWEIFDFYSETAQRNSTKPDRNQDLNIFCYFFFILDRNTTVAIRKQDLKVCLLLWNRWMEFNETQQDTRSKRSLPKLCLDQDDRLGLRLVQAFSTILRNSKMEFNEGRVTLTISNKYVFLETIANQGWPS